MKSKRLALACSDMQRRYRKECVCAGSVCWTGTIQDPCTVPCDPLLERFLNGLVG